MPLDVDNPWEAHAYFNMGFHCEDCKTPFEFFSDLESTSDDWCVAIARAAFQAGWFVPHPTTDGHLDVVNAWCPDCGKKRNLTQPPYARQNADNAGDPPQTT